MRDKIKPDLWTKTFAGVIGGFCIAIGVSGLFAWFGPGGISASIKGQAVMWMVPPVWMLVLSFSYLFKSGGRAVMSLAVLSALLLSVNWMLKSGVLRGR